MYSGEDTTSMYIFGEGVGDKGDKGRGGGACMYICSVHTTNYSTKTKF
jgi:hypothetical protein